MGDRLTPDEVRRLIGELLADILELRVDEVGPDDDLIDELDADSLQRLELMSEVEHHIGVRIDAGAWREARTLAALTELTLEKLRESQPR
jgi:acyl carrier protein